MKVSVTRDKENESEIILLDMKDVLYIHTEDRTILYHTHEGIYYHLLPSLSKLSNNFKKIGFTRLDRTNLVNTCQIRHFDMHHGKVFFEEQITKNSKFTTVSFFNKTKLQKDIHQWIQKNIGH